MYVCLFIIINPSPFMAYLIMLSDTNKSVTLSDHILTKLKSATEFCTFSPYINSGNVLFCSQLSETRMWMCLCVSAGSCAGGSTSVSERQRWSAAESEGPGAEGFWSWGRDRDQSPLERQNQTSQSLGGAALIETCLLFTVISFLLNRWLCCNVDLL